MRIKLQSRLWVLLIGWGFKPRCLPPAYSVISMETVLLCICHLSLPSGTCGVWWFWVPSPLLWGDSDLGRGLIKFGGQPDDNTYEKTRRGDDEKHLETPPAVLFHPPRPWSRLNRVISNGNLFFRCWWATGDLKVCLGNRIGFPLY